MKKVISLMWIIGIYAMIFRVALMIISFRARGRYQASYSKVRLRQPASPVSASFLKGGKQRSAADAFGASALGPTPTASLCS